MHYAITTICECGSRLPLGETFSLLTLGSQPRGRIPRHTERRVLPTALPRRTRSLRSVLSASSVLSNRGPTQPFYPSLQEGAFSLCSALKALFVRIRGLYGRTTKQSLCEKPCQAWALTQDRQSTPRGLTARRSSHSHPSASFVFRRPHGRRKQAVSRRFSMIRIIDEDIMDYIRMDFTNYGIKYCMEW